MKYTVALVGLVGCSGPVVGDIERPALTVSAEELDFGEVADEETVERTVIVANEGGLPMGIDAIAIGDGSDSFAVDLEGCDVECDGTDAKEDTGPSWSDDTAVVERGPCAEADGTPLVLDPGCRLPITVTFEGRDGVDAYDALVVVATGEDVPAGEVPSYFVDPVHGKRITWLHGSTPASSTQAIVASPRSYDFGFVYPGATASGTVEFTSVGADDAMIYAVSVGACDETFSVLSVPADGTVLAPGESVSMEVRFTPTTTDYRWCAVEAETPTGTWDILFTGNASTAANTAPSVTITAPSNGYAYTTDAPLELELEVSDAEQPASSLGCEVESAVLGSGSVSCSVADDGFATIELPSSFFLPGSDTLRVTVTDAHGATGVATVSVGIDGTDAGADGDAFDAAADCDDADADSYPEAVELADGRDNDCDGVVDEGTDAYDDDGDGTTEDAGDCDDTRDDTMPGTTELLDRRDNDCNGIVDDQTDVYDDDGDGFSEMDQDCDDTDPTLSPAAAEVCDGVDNDCDTLRDWTDGCVATDTDPIVIGDTIWMEQSGVLEGESVGVTVRVFDADGDPALYSWSTDGGGHFDNATAASPTFTAPDVVQPLVQLPWNRAWGRNENIYAVILDPDGHQDWAFEKLAVYRHDAGIYDPITWRVAGGHLRGCSSGGGAAGAWGALVALALTFRRRSPPPRPRGP